LINSAQRIDKGILDGQELVSSRLNRIVNTSILVSANSEIVIPIIRQNVNPSAPAQH
jgi:hypothetical protein